MQDAVELQSERTGYMDASKLGKDRGQSAVSYGGTRVQDI